MLNHFHHHSSLLCNSTVNTNIYNFVSRIQSHDNIVAFYWMGYNPSAWTYKYSHWTFVSFKCSLTFTETGLTILDSEFYRHFPMFCSLFLYFVVKAHANTGFQLHLFLLYIYHLNSMELHGTDQIHALTPTAFVVWREFKWIIISISIKQFHPSQSNI